MPNVESDTEKFEERWADMVEYYTKCEMTHPSQDRLVAISGMMSSISERTRQVFVHGLLKSRLATELLWLQWVDCHGDDAKQPKRTGTETNAPTWSWGSVIGRISPFWARRLISVQRRQPWLIELDASLERTAPAAIQAVSGVAINPVCKVEFQAPIVEATCQARLDLRHYRWKVQGICQTGPDSFLEITAYFWPDEAVNEGMAVWLLRGAVLVTSDQQKATQHAGLVVVPTSASNVASAYWKRIGYWQTFTEIKPLTHPSEAEKQMAMRTVLNHRMKTMLLV